MSTVRLNEMRLLVRSTQSFGHEHHFDIKGQVQGDVILIPYLPIHIVLVYLPTKHKGIGSKDQKVLSFHDFSCKTMDPKDPRIFF